jgi:hypothetical protein
MRLAALLSLVFLAGCAAPGGFLGTGIGAPPPPPAQPEGFAVVHWIAYAGGFLMIVLGAALFWLLQQPKAGAGLVATGLCTIALALAAAFYAKALAVGALILLGVGMAGAVGWLLLYAWNKRAQFREVVTQANGSIDVATLTPKAAAAVAKVKAAITTETRK